MLALYVQSRKTQDLDALKLKRHSLAISKSDSRDEIPIKDWSSAKEGQLLGILGMPVF